MVGAPGGGGKGVKKKKGDKSTLQRTDSATSTAMLTDNPKAVPVPSGPEATGIDVPPDPYKSFAKSHKKTLFAPVSKLIKSHHSSVTSNKSKELSVSSPPPLPSVNPIPSRPWNPQMYAVSSVKFEPLCAPKSADRQHNPKNNSSEAPGKNLPAFHGLRSLLLDCEKTNDQSKSKKPK